MSDVWKASITRSADEKRWLVFLNNDMVPAAFTTYHDADEYIKEKFGVTGLCSEGPLLRGGARPADV